MKNMRKKLAALLSALCLCVGLIPGALAVSYTDLGYAKCGENVTWSLKDGVLRFTGSGPMYDSMEYAEGNGVTTYGPPWTYGSRREEVRSIVVEEGITSLVDNIAAGCWNLTSVSLPSTLTDLRDFAFSDCDKLTTVNLSEGLTTIGTQAFIRCDKLTSIHIPSTVKEIGGSAFNDCESLTTINLPEGLTKISHGLFDGCISLTNLTLPSTLTSIDSWAFDRCRSLTRLDVPEGVTAMGDFALAWCTNLQYLTLPSTLRSVQDYTFAHCANLLEIQMAPENPYFVSENGALYSADKQTLYRYPTGRGGHAVVPEGVTTIGHDAFSSGAAITSVKLPTTLKELGMAAFENCTGLTEFKIPQGTTEFGQSCLNGCKNLKSLTVPASMDTFYILAIAGTDSLETIHVSRGSKGEEWAKSFDGYAEGKLQVVCDQYAQPTTRSVNIDGKPVMFHMVTLENGAVSYVRLADVAQALKGTEAEFNVGWDGFVQINSWGGFNGESDDFQVMGTSEYLPYTSPTYINAIPFKLDAIEFVWNDEGHVYYRLRELGQSIGFNVGWSAEKGIFIETDKPYDASN